jgi:hypothetical protein
MTKRIKRRKTQVDFSDAESLQKVLDQDKILLAKTTATDQMLLDHLVRAEESLEPLGPLAGKPLSKSGS